MRHTSLLALLASVAAPALAAPPLLYAPLDGDMRAQWALGDPITPMTSMSGPFIEGVRGQARRLGGRNTTSYFVDSGFLPPRGTCSLWVKPMDWTPGASQHFVFFTAFNYTAADDGYVRTILYKIYNETDLTLIFQNTIGQERASLLRTPIEFWQKRQWHHVAFTWDPDHYRLYVDGRPCGEVQTVPLPETGRWEIMLGTPYEGWAYVGTETSAFDEFTIWAEVLPAEEIKRMYDEIAPSLPPPPAAVSGTIGSARENLALARNGGFALASSFRDYEASYPDNLLDDDLESVWRPDEPELPQWLEVRWPVPVRVDEVLLLAEGPGQIRRVSAHAWDPGTQTWLQVGTGEAGARFAETLTGRLRVVIEDSDVAQLAVSEFQVFGSPQPLLARLKPYWRAAYIWYPEADRLYRPNEPRYFRHTFAVADPAQVHTATLQLRSNDHYRAWLNGVQVATGSSVITPVEVAPHLVAGPNVLAVEAELHSNPGQWGWGELLYELALNYQTHSEYVSSGDGTLCAATAPDGWLGPDFAAANWVPAERFVSPPQGVWGEIPYYAQPVGEQVAYGGLRVTPERPRPGDEVTVTVRVTAAQPLHDDYFCVLEVGQGAVMPDWDNFDVCSVPLLPDPPTSQWPAGQPQELTFRFVLPAFAPDGTVPVRFRAYGTGHGAPLELVGADGQSVAQVGALTVARPVMDVATPALPRLDLSTGAPALARDGALSPPVAWALRANSWDRYHLYGDTGVHLYHIQTHPLKIDDDPETLALAQRFADERIATVLRVDPLAQFIVMIELRPSNSWLEANPGERLVTAMGTPGPVSYWSATHFRTVDRFLEGLIGHLRQQPYWPRIVGYLPMSCGAPDSTIGGFEANLFQKDRSKITVGDFNPQAVAAFREWLRGKYETVEGLRQAWRDPEVTFDSFELNISELVREGADGGVFRDPADSGLTLDYFDFLSTGMGQYYSHVMAKVKQLAGPQALVGTYYGYTVGHMRGYNNPGSIFNGNNFDLHQRLQDPNWDFFAGPLPYESRAAGLAFKSYHATASVLLHGKLIINEIDHRTFVASPTTYGRLHSRRETEAVLKRDLGGSVVDGSGYWFADWSGPRGRDSVGFFSDPSILQTVRETTAAYAETLRQPKSGGAEVALLVHGGTMACMDVYRSAPLYRNLVARTAWDEMAKMGAPYDTYLLEDLTDPRVQAGYKLYVLLNPFLLSDRERQAIEALKRDGKTLLFLYAPGYADRQSGLSDANVTALTGFRVSHGPADEIMRYRITHTGHPVTEGLSEGQEYAVEAFDYELSRELHPPAFGPVFRIEDAGEAALGVFPDGGTALAARDMGDWQSVYCTVPYVSSGLLRGVCRYAGVHLYCDEDVLLKADNRCLMVHNGYGQARALTLALPGERRVTDLCTGQELAGGARSLRLELAEAETRILGLSPPR